MSLSSLTHDVLKELLLLVEEREKLRARTSELDSEIAAIASGKPLRGRKGGRKSVSKSTFVELASDDDFYLAASRAVEKRRVADERALKSKRAKQA